MSVTTKKFSDDGCCPVCGSDEYDEYEITEPGLLLDRTEHKQHCHGCTVPFHNSVLFGQAGKAKVELVKPKSSSGSLNDPVGDDDKGSIYHCR